MEPPRWRSGCPARPGGGIAAAGTVPPAACLRSAFTLATDVPGSPAVSTRSRDFFSRLRSGPGQRMVDQDHVAPVASAAVDLVHLPLPYRSTDWACPPRAVITAAMVAPRNGPGGDSLRAVVGGASAGPERMGYRSACSPSLTFKHGSSVGRSGITNGGGFASIAAGRCFPKSRDGGKRAG